MTEWAPYPAYGLYGFPRRSFSSYGHLPESYLITREVGAPDPHATGRVHTLCTSTIYVHTHILPLFLNFNCSIQKYKDKIFSVPEAQF